MTATAWAFENLDWADNGPVTFTEEPVPLSTFVQDKKYLANPPLSEVQFEAVRHAERVYYPGTYEVLSKSDDKVTRDYWGAPTRLVNFITLQWGKGAGKDHICRIISLRIAYLLLCLPSPQDYYQMPEQDTIHLLNVASSSRQASRAFFAPMRRAVSRPGSWFQDMGVEVHEVGRGQRQPKSELQTLQDTIRFAKNIEAISGHSDAETQEGLNLMLGIADEIDAFKRREELARHHGNAERDSTRSAEGILEMLRSSGRTRFPEVFKNLRISYPRYKGSMIQILTDEARERNEQDGEKSSHYVSGPLATWDVNPRVHGKEAFADDYKSDPIFSRAKYECQPTRALNPYFTNETAVEGCMEEVEAQPLTLDYELIGNAWAPRHAFSSALRPIKGALYAMHADLARNQCRAGIAVAHVVKHQEIIKVTKDEEGREFEMRETRPLVRVDFVIGYEALLGVNPPREIQIRWARELWFELVRRGFAMRKFTFDKFESLDSRQVLETQYGVETDRVSTDLSNEPWRDLRDLFSEDRLRVARIRREEEPGNTRALDWTRIFLNELFALSLTPQHRVDHPPGGSKDLADAVACAVQGALKLGGEEEEGPDNTAFPGGTHTLWHGRAEGNGVPAGLEPLAAMAGMGSDPLALTAATEPHSGDIYDTPDLAVPFGWGSGYQP